MNGVLIQFPVKHTDKEAEPPFSTLHDPPLRLIPQPPAPVPKLGDEVLRPLELLDVAIDAVHLLAPRPLPSMGTI